VAKLPRKDAVRRLFETFGSAPPNIAAISVGADGSVRVEYREVSVAPAAPPAPVKFVPGTNIPDDGSPLNAADLTLNPIDLEERN
jgi:hypothetical protein